MKYYGYILVLLAATAQAEVYKSINADGEIIYSDVPTRGAKRVQLPALPTYTPAPLPVAPAPVSPKQAAGTAYSGFSMTSPRDDETIRSNAGIVNLSVTLEPGLQIEEGHRIQYFLDDKPQGKPVARTSSSFNNVDRGTHRVSATVIDESGASIIKTAPVTVHIMRVAILHPNNPLNPANQGSNNGAGTGGTSGSGNGSSNGSNTGSSGSKAQSGSSGGNAGASGDSGGSAAGSTGSSSRSVGF